MHPLFETLAREAAASLDGLNGCDTQRTPRNHPEKWTIQQIVEHLILTYRATIPVLEKRLEKGAPTLARLSVAQRLGQWSILRLGRFPSGRKSPLAVEPAGLQTVQSGAGLTDRMRAELAALDTLLAAGERLFGSRRAASHLILGPLSMQGWRTFHLTHARHHLRQIARIRAEYRLDERIAADTASYPDAAG